MCVAGTIRINRFFNQPVISDKEKMKMGSGTSCKIISTLVVYRIFN